MLELRVNVDNLLRLCDDWALDLLYVRTYHSVVLLTRDTILRRPAVKSHREFSHYTRLHSR